MNKKIEEIDNLVDELLYDYGFTTDKGVVTESYREMGKDMTFKLKQKLLNLLNTEVQKAVEDGIRGFANWLDDNTRDNYEMARVYLEEKRKEIK